MYHAPFDGIEVSETISLGRVVWISGPRVMPVTGETRGGTLRRAENAPKTLWGLNWFVRCSCNSHEAPHALWIGRENVLHTCARHFREVRCAEHFQVIA